MKRGFSRLGFLGLGSVVALTVSGLLAMGMTALPAAASATTTSPTTTSATAVAVTAGSAGPAALGAGPAGPVSPVAAALAASSSRQRQVALLARQPGKVTGTVRSVSGLPLAGACVTATGAAGAARGLTSVSGRFTLSGLRAGRYLLTYQDCAHPDRYLPQWSGGAQLPGMARQLTIAPGRVTSAGVIALRPAGPAALFARPSAAQLARAAGLPSGSPRWGGVSGRVVGPTGRPITDTCVEVGTRAFTEGVPLSSKGIYHTGRNLPPGQYTVQFASLDCGRDPGNWAPQWYKDQVKQSKATKITVRAGKVTRHIDATLWHGGILTGKVLSRSGAKVDHGCVYLLTRHGGYLTQARSGRNGGYVLRGLPAGGYRVAFEGSCFGQSKYLLQYWKNSASFKKARTINIRLRQTVSGINAALVTGATITGTVRYDSAAGRPLSGICVFTWNGFASTNHDGRYVIEGLKPGRVWVQFAPGCNNNGNYLQANYPHALHVVDGTTYAGINAHLLPGGIISGTVTDTAGRPLANVEVDAEDNAGDSNSACTSKTGSFSLDQLPPGSYTVEFVNDCTSHGNYAPQFYPDQPQPAGATPVKVTYGQRVTGIDARMRPGSIITGTVTSHAGQAGPKICAYAQAPGDAYASVEFSSPLGGPTRTSSNGGYRITNLAAGRYAVEFGPCGTADIQDTWFGKPSGSAIGDIVNVAAAATVGGVNGVTAPGGAIAGTIRDRSGHRLNSICVIATNRRTGGYFYNGESASHYQISQLPPGRYTVQFYNCEAADYAAQWYAGKHGPGKASTVVVTAGRVTRDINATMTKGGDISGRVIAQATGAPARGFCVFASTASGTYFGFGETSRDGDYVVTGLNTGRYTLTVTYCYGGRSSLADVTTRRTVTVTAPRDVTGFNVALPDSGSMSGRVLAGKPSAMGQAVCVTAYPLSSQSVANEAFTGDSGRYSLTNLLPGSYRVYFDPVTDCDYSLNGLRPRWYDNAATRATATIVTVKPGQTSTGISATLATDGSISGKVTAASSGSSLAGICVLAIPKTAGRPASFTATATGTGRYRLTGLAPGSYTVKFSSGCGATGYATQWWQDASNTAKATIITVTNGTADTGINAALRK